MTNKFHLITLQILECAPVGRDWYFLASSLLRGESDAAPVQPSNSTDDGLLPHTYAMKVENARGADMNRVAELAQYVLLTPFGHAPLDTEFTTIGTVLVHHRKVSATQPLWRIRPANVADLSYFL